MLLSGKVRQEERDTPAIRCASSKLAMSENSGASRNLSPNMFPFPDSLMAEPRTRKEECSACTVGGMATGHPKMVHAPIPQAKDSTREWPRPVA